MPSTCIRNFGNSAQGSNTENGIFMEEYPFSISARAVCRKLWKLTDWLEYSRVGNCEVYLAKSCLAT